MANPIRIGVIGCGGIAQMMHLPFLAERPDLFSIESLADIDSSTVEAMGRRYHVNRIHTDYHDLLDDPVDAILILSGDSHRQPVLDAVLAKKHVLVEKPLGENLQEVEEVAKEVKRAGTTLLVGYHKRYDPGYLYAREQVRKLKDLRMVRVDVLHPVDARARDHYYLEPCKDPSLSRSDNSEATDGLVQAVRQGPARKRIDAIIGSDAPEEQQIATFLLFNSLIHDTNVLRGILGEPEEVLSAGFWRGGRCIHVVLRWSSDVHCAMSWIYLPGLNHYKEELLFLSPERRVCINFPSPYFKHFPTPIIVESMEGDHFVESKVTVSLEEAFRAELQHFHECVTRGVKPRTGIEDAIADTILLEKIAKRGSRH
ncbi:MAG: Gfo/Idh/MocA family oxidoreductase [Pseudomonadota bacterium]